MRRTWLMAALGAFLFSALVLPLGAAEPDVLPAPYVATTGSVRGFEVLPVSKETSAGPDFCFWFRPMGKKKAEPDGEEWFVILRESTPFENFRLGPTHLKVDAKTMRDGTVIDLVGVRGVDRIPESFHDRELPKGRTVTAFLISLPPAPGKPSEPLYVNNWLHSWRKAEDGSLLDGLFDPDIAGRYVDRQGPYWITGWLPADTQNPDSAKRLAEVRELLEPEALAKIAATPFKKGVYRGYLVRDPQQKLGYRLRLTQFWRHNPATGGHDLILGDDAEVERLR